MTSATPPGVDESTAGGAAPRAPTRSRPMIAAFNGTVIIFLLVAAVVIWRHERAKKPAVVALAPQEEPAHLGVLTVTLFFASRDAGELVAERREIAAGDGGIETMVRRVIDELGRGPAAGGSPVLPEGAALQTVFQDSDGIVYLDFSEAFRSRHWGGAAGERLTIEALRRTIAANFAAIQSVRVLVAGESVESIAGHIGVAHPITVGGR